MKTPSFLPLLILFAALPAAADPQPGERCEVKWLETTQAILSKPGGYRADLDRIEVVGDSVKLKFGSLKTCDAATWRNLATVEPISGEVVLDPRTKQPVGGVGLRWRNSAAAAFWKDADAAQQIGFVLVASDFYAIIDAKAKAIVAAGDEVIDAAKALGFVDFKASEKSLAELSKGTSGGPTGAIKPRLVTVFAESKPASIPQEQFGPTMRKLVNDGPTLGDAVVRFRVAVLDLEATLGSLGKSSDFLKKRGVGAIAGLNDFTSGLPKEFVAVAAVPASALAEDKYASALAALVGPGARAELGDQGLRGAALLDPIDLGLRNLIIARSAEVDLIFAAAKKRLGGKTIADFGVTERTNGLAGKEKPGSLSEAVVKRLSESPDYKKLDAMYEDRRGKPGFDEWAKSSEAQGILTARDSMIAAARTAAVETTPDGKVVVFTQGGKKIALTSVVPSSVENDPAARNDVAGMISRYIVEGAKDDASTRAALAVVGGAAEVGKPMDTNLTTKEGEVAKTVPPAIKKINDGAAGCDNPKDLVRNDYETYAARQRAAAAAMAGGNVRDRNQIEKTRTAALAASAVECDKRKAAAAVKKGADDFDGADVVADLRAKALAEAKAWCEDDVKKIEGDAVLAAKTLTEAEAGARNPKALSDKADADLAASFSVAVSASVETLRKDYTNPAGGPRVKKLIADAALSGSSPRLFALTTLWFDQNWPQKDEKRFLSAVTLCAEKLGFKPGSDKASYQNPENPDNVAKTCGIQADLTKSIKDSVGSVHLLPPLKQP
jgi:hypothetical protein